MTVDTPTPMERQHAETLLVIGQALFALAKLPDTPDAIALFLASHGVKGEPCGSADDALAVWLRRFVPCAVRSFQDRVELEGGRWSFTLYHPSHVRRFVVGFDAGEWPYLHADDAR